MMDTPLNQYGSQFDPVNTQSTNLSIVQYNPLNSFHQTSSPKEYVSGFEFNLQNTDIHYPIMNNDSSDKTTPSVNTMMILTNKLLSGTIHLSSASANLTDNVARLVQFCETVDNKTKSNKTQIMASQLKIKYLEKTIETLEKRLSRLPMVNKKHHYQQTPPLPSNPSSSPRTNKPLSNNECTAIVTAAVATPSVIANSNIRISCENFIKTSILHNENVLTRNYENQKSPVEYQNTALWILRFIGFYNSLSTNSATNAAFKQFYGGKLTLKKTGSLSTKKTCRLPGRPSDNLIDTKKLILQADHHYRINIPMLSYLFYKIIGKEMSQGSIKDVLNNFLRGFNCNIQFKIN